MRKWGYGINSFHNKANIYVDDAPWWVFALDDLVEAICGIIPSVPFSNARLKLKDPEEIEFHGGQWTTLKEWYGDLNQYFHVRVHCPVFEFCQRRIKTNSVEITYARAREMFYESDKKLFDQEAEQSEGLEDFALLPDIESARLEYEEKGGRSWEDVKNEIQHKE